MKYFFLPVSFIAVTLGLSGCASNEDPVLNFPQKEMLSLHAKKFTPSLSLTGTVESNKSIDLASKVSGRIQSLFVDIGDSVQKGEIVAQFSVTDDQSQIAYSNAVAQLHTTEVSTQSALQSAKMAVLNAEQQHKQAQKQEAANMKQLLDTLSARTNSSETLVERIIHFLDTTLGISPQFQYGGNSSLMTSIGSNDTIKKQRLKNDIAAFLQKKKDITFPFSQEPLENARQELKLLKQLEDITQAFYSLTQNTPVTGNFSEIQKSSLTQTIENFLSEMSGDILALEGQMRATETAREQLGLGLIQTENEVQNAQSQLDMAQANAQQQVQLAQNRISATKNLQEELELKAPFSGIITHQFIEEGALIAAGNPVFSLADRTILKIETDVPDVQSWSLSEGMAVEIHIDGIPLETFLGKISRINPAVNPHTRTLGIEITLDDSPEQVKIGMFARVKIVLPTRTAFFIPKQYIHTDFSGSFVVTEDGKHIAIQQGIKQNGVTEIISSDLSEGLVLQAGK